MNPIHAGRTRSFALRNLVLQIDSRPAHTVICSKNYSAEIVQLRPRRLRRHFTTSLPRLAPSQVESQSHSECVKAIFPDAAQPLSKQIAAKPPSPELPRSCPGCGALTQDIQPDQPGYYSRSRRVVKQYLKGQKKQASTVTEDDTPGTGGPDVRNQDEQGQDADADADADADSAIKHEPTSGLGLKIPFCDRCHDLVHNSRGQSIAHPSIDDIADSIAESPFRRNHVYHVLDAADFPMSLIPDIFKKINLAKPRSQNRRSQHDFSTKPTVSFIITRSDLLGSTKEMVDSMMLYFQTVLREALGRTGRDMRLGNVHLVSAKRGWWTKEIKEDIWKRGGGNWLVGKVNVGKSNLFEVLFPKGSGERAPVYAELQKQQEKLEQQESAVWSKNDLLDEGRLLPPPQPESPFPVLPVVSSLPGTTASPIRLPFGGHRGELVDLPGLERGDLENYVNPEHTLGLIMSHRENVKQHNIRPGQCLLLGGGLIRITPQFDGTDASMTLLAYPFVPLEAHVTSMSKADTFLQQGRKDGESILVEGTAKAMASAGEFKLTTDVTKTRSGPLIKSGVPVAKLPFRVYATDILLEGIGWVELVCQVRRQRVPQPASGIVAFDNGTGPNVAQSGDSASETDYPFAPFATQPPLTSGSGFVFPKVEILSPNGRYVSQRQSLQAWSRWTDGRRQKDASKLARPRRSMKGATR